MMGQNLRRIREAKRLSQIQLAERVGITSQYLSNLERSKMRPSLDVIEKLAAALGIPVSDLFRDDLSGLQDALGVYLRARGPWSPEQEERIRQDIELVIRLQKERARVEREAEEAYLREKRRKEQEQT